MKWGLTKKNREQESLVDSLHRDISRVFDDFFSISPTSMFEFDWSPTVDVMENEGGFLVKAEIPGIDEKDLQVTLENNILTIAGEKKEERSEKDRDSRWVVSERKFGSFRRSISLPEGIRSDKIKAAFRNGVLRVEIPREESAKPRKITIDVK